MKIHHFIASTEEDIVDDYYGSIASIAAQQKAALSAGTHLVSTEKKNDIAKMASISIPQFLFSYRTLKKQGSEADVVHAHFWAAGLAASAKKIVYSSYFPTKAEGIKHSIEAKVFDKAKAIIFTSAVLRDLATKHHPGIERKSHVIPLCLDFEAVSQTKKFDLHERYGIDKNKKIILYAGPLNKNVGIKYLIESIPSVDASAMLIIAGDGPEKEKMMTTVDAFGIANLVKFIPALSHKEMIAATKDASVVVLPYLDDAPDALEFHYSAALAAFACHVPLITTKIGLMNELIEDKKTAILTETADSLGITKEINHLFSDTQAAQSLTTKAHEYVKATYDVPVVAKKLQDLYAKL